MKWFEHGVFVVGWGRGTRQGMGGWRFCTRSMEMACV